MQLTHRTRPTFSFGLLTLASALWLAGCANRPTTDHVPPPPPMASQATSPLQGDGPQNMLDWAGTYQAVLPCDGCSGIAISVQLRENRTAVVRERRMGGDIEKAAPQTYSGPFHFDGAKASTITLANTNEAASYRFFVAEGWIEMRANDTGAPLAQSALYRLRKTSEPSS
jgi:uncharacterized lipoprotein NlpE involved in copper resistance